jgi:hypothetical protein
LASLLSKAPGSLGWGRFFAFVFHSGSGVAFAILFSRPSNAGRAMHFVYVDDSKDWKLACFSALIIPADRWRECLDWLLEARRELKRSDGIHIRKEIHATDWIGGKGAIAPKPVTKQRRAELFNILLTRVAEMPSAQLINAAVPLPQEERVFERLLNRINVNMTKAGSRAVLFSDEGKGYDSMLRRMRHYNFIGSKFGRWPEGVEAKNITIDRILEDIVYRDSRRSLFVQAADWCGYALLRRENPIPSKTKLGLDRSFFILEPIMVKAAYGADPYGVIR